jgi:hypothetical protein
MLSVTNIDLYSYKCLALDKVSGKKLYRGATTGCVWRPT